MSKNTIDSTVSQISRDGQAAAMDESRLESTKKEHFGFSPLPARFHN